MDGAEGVFKAVDRRHDCADPPEQERIPLCDSRNAASCPVLHKTVRWFTLNREVRSIQGQGVSA